MTQAYDLVVFGGTPSGVAAATVMAERGRSVVLISQFPTVGGAISNGLGAADIGSKTAITGFPKRFFDAVKAKYNDQTTYNVSPADAEAIFRTFLTNAGVTVVTNAALVSVNRTGRQVSSITTSAGQFSAKTFIDATYTGDLADKAGAGFRLGYGDFFAYGEDYTQDREFTTTATLLPADLPGADAAFAANPFIDVGPRGPYSMEAKNGMPSMTFRLCVTKVAANRVPFAQTANYETYADSWRRWMRGVFASTSSAVTVKSNGTITSAAFQIAKTNATKWDLNAGSGSFMNVPIPMEYFAGDRQAVIDQFEDYHRNWLYFLQNDSAIPSEIRTAFADFGLCADEFTDNGNWPYEPYIREGRRIQGRALLTTAGIYSADRRDVVESMGIGTYELDGKLSIIYYDQGQVRRDMGQQLSVPWYEIPRGVMVPVGIDNLLVTFAISASPRAFGSFRMEPQAMALGEAAGADAYVAYLHGSNAADATYTSVRYILNQNGAQTSIVALCQATASAYRASAGFDPVTCAPASYTP